MATFQNAMQAGMQAVQFGVNRADRQAQLDIDNRRQDERDTQERLDREIDRKRRDKMAETLDFELQTKRDEAKRFVEASDAFEKFSAAAGILDSGDPASIDQYATVTRQYLPSILKHEGIARKWEAADRVFKQGKMFTVRKMADAAAIRAMEEAAQIAPEVMLNPPKLPDGTPDYAAIRSTIEERRQAMEDHAVKLRRASVDARVDAEAAGAYGGRTATKPTMGPGTKAELDAVADELREVNKRILELSGTKLTRDPSTFLDDGSSAGADKMRDLVNRKASLQRQLRSFDRMVAPQPAQAPDPQGPAGSGPQAPKAPDAPGKEGASRTIKIGNEVWQLNIRD